MKQNPNQQKGFTLVELLVVISIMMFAFAIVLTGLNQQRIKRSVSIAQNETTTNIRKVQSYMLSSRNIGAKPVKFYIVQFTLDSSTYTVRAVDQDYTYYDEVEKVSLKDGAQVSGLNLVDRNGVSQSGGCAQLIFAAPFGKIYMNSTPCDSSIVTILKNPVAMVELGDASLDISLNNPRSTLTKTITVSGFSNKVTAN